MSGDKEAISKELDAASAALAGSNEKAAGLAKQVADLLAKIA